jgi:hypothetical protein
MKAIVQDRYGSSDVLKLAEIDEPSPGSNECSYACAQPPSTRATGT